MTGDAITYQLADRGTIALNTALGGETANLLWYSAALAITRHSTTCVGHFREHAVIRTGESHRALGNMQFLKED